MLCSEWKEDFFHWGQVGVKCKYVMKGGYRHGVKLSFVVQKCRDKGLGLSFTIMIKCK